ncbi:MAG: cell division protein ZapB [Desulfobulbaceae bacterium]|jgi:chromosome segregation ATPase|nr:cell division protein ZapB [Desulfobulbaceae bacterium]
MKQDSELGRLENFVAKLLDRFNALQADKGKVDELLLEREETIATLQEELASLKDERGEISSRVSGLLGRIEEWEAGVKESGDSDGSERGSSEGGVVQGSLF